MHASDFLHNETLHGLLFDIFRSEIGLLSVSHPQAQMDALVEFFADHKVKLLQAAEEECTVFLQDYDFADYTPAGTVEVTLRQEVDLFRRLYAFPELFAIPSALAHHVQGLIGPIVSKHPGYRALTVALLVRHLRRFSTPGSVSLQNRVFKTLSLFKLEELQAETLEGLNALAAPTAEQP